MIQAPRGTKDILPAQASQWQFVEGIFREITARFGYREIRTPVFESAEVFSRSIGEATDIVNKEMYVFDDRGGNKLTLRPEQTAALVRAAIQNGLAARGEIERLWYAGPYFRYERPQKGRYRQFHQFGAECLSSPHPESDTEIILLAAAVTKALGIDEFRLNLNSLGNKESRGSYREALVNFLYAAKEKLTEESQQRLVENPLRVLDSKAPQDIEACVGAPAILDYLDTESKEHFDTVCSILSECGIEYVINPNLVRGLDYYSHTVFEFQSTALGSQDAFGGGGRYNDLFQELGGKATPAVGFAMGIERLLLIIESLGKFPAGEKRADISVIVQDIRFSGTGNDIARQLREKGYSVLTDISRRSFKSQFREADKSGAAYSVVVAETELGQGKVLLKNMQSGEQREVLLSEIKELAL